MSKPLITVKNLKILKSDKILLDNLDFTIHESDRIILVGENGSGKTSLMRIIKGIDDADQGTIWKRPNLKIDYLDQNPSKPKIQNLEDFLSQDVEYPDLSKIKDIINQLELSDIRLEKQLSIGEIRKVYIAKSLLNESDILLFDEPTNHIDLPTISWLEDKLLSIKKSMLIVSHDQNFLKKIGTKTYWLYQNELISREGLYDGFYDWAETHVETRKTQSSKIKQKIKSETKWSIEGISARRKRNMGRVRELEKLTKHYESTKINEKRTMDFSLKKTNDSGSNIIELKNVSFAYNSDLKKEIISNFNLKIEKKERLGIIGANGSGKTTLIKMIQGLILPSKGKIKTGENINIKYFDQNKETIDTKLTPWRSLSDEGDHVNFLGQKIHVLSYLKMFLFNEKKSLQSNSSLSGGEKVRLLLAKLFLNDHNFLILDEPTNDLDFYTLNILKDIIKKYDGTVLIISHDRFFLDHTIDKLLVFENDNKITKHEGNFSSYYSKYGLSKVRKIKPTQSVKRNIQKTNKFVNKGPNVKKLSYKEAYALTVLPKEISKLEDKLNLLEKQLNEENLYHNDFNKFNSIISEITKIKDDLSTKEDNWLKLQILNEEINST
ncbi:ABC-F family ATP-binding cassette domain-containing protein [Alphaproteobacteria bacterium]|nr:ABC-F family ATP-binding cassette domain-containing protein [Alphaproteobacteria bacterium]MDC1086645.1 ABC-F family ATP-binding cassette domain-containing protein [Alphaproteobacteria bacterium]